MINGPLLSICIPTYNRSEILDKTLESLKQLYSEIHTRFYHTFTNKQQSIIDFKSSLSFDLKI